MDEVSVSGIVAVAGGEVEAPSVLLGVSEMVRTCAWASFLGTALDVPIMFIVLGSLGS